MRKKKLNFRGRKMPPRSRMKVFGLKENDISNIFNYLCREGKSCSYFPISAEPVQNIWQEKNGKFELNLNWFQGVTFTFEIKMCRKKIFSLIFHITDSQRTKAGYGVFAQILGFFPAQPLIIIWRRIFTSRNWK